MVGSDHDLDEEWSSWRREFYEYSEDRERRERREQRRLWRVAILLGMGFYLLLMVAAAWSADLSVPDLTITPGVVACTSKEAVCNTKWGKDKRHVTAGMKREVFALYGLSGNDDKSCRLDRHGRRFEIDHAVSRELCGADAVKNLWPQCYSGKWNAVMKDRLENRLHREVCRGAISLEAAQREISLEDWRVAYRKYFGEPR
jgi:hypothetical protein